MFTASLGLPRRNPFRSTLFVMKPRIFSCVPLMFEVTPSGLLTPPGP
jgi:hypothetical protein